MRFVDRTKVQEPSSLKAPSPAVAKEKEAAKHFYATIIGLDVARETFPFKEYRGFDVGHQLRTLFEGKCAYCESELGDGLEIEHFRPKGGVAGEPGHAGYWWLAHAWSNLLPSCVPCNQRRRQHIVSEDMTLARFRVMVAKRPRQSHGKADQFPVAGQRAVSAECDLRAERALLIDPTHDDPELYLDWSRRGHFSVVLARESDEWSKSRALSTIATFALNRANLVASRTKLLLELRFHAEKILEDLEEDRAQGRSEVAVQKAVDRVETMRRLEASAQPFSAMARAFISQFMAELKRRAPVIETGSPGRTVSE